MKTTQELREFLDRNGAVAAAEARVMKKMRNVVPDDYKLIGFINDYSRWNAQFAGGVASLVALISKQPHFMEPGFPRDLADRSTYVASYIFDAAIDEYNDHINIHRDPHRSHAQAMLSAMAEFMTIPSVAGFFSQEIPQWITALRAYVYEGYTGKKTLELTGRSILATFHGMGYHLGSELLADREFSIIDNHLRSDRPELVDFLKRKTVVIADARIRAYSWIGIHSGQGGGAEADHFDFALQGTIRGLKYLHDADEDECVAALDAGFQQFVGDHKMFFEIP